MNLDLLSNDSVVSNQPVRKVSDVSTMTVRTGVRAGAVKYMRSSYSY